MTQRLFVALQPPPEARRAMLGVMGGVEEAYWQSDAQLHLTLAFLGHVDRHTANDVADALDRLRHDPINVTLTVYGTFDAGKYGRISSLWVGAGPAAPLTSLAARVRQTCRQAGSPVEARRFLPHITLARFPRYGAPPVVVQRFLLGTPPPVAQWTAEEVTLFESRLGSGGAHYEPLGHFRFAGDNWHDDQRGMSRTA